MLEMIIDEKQRLELFRDFEAQRAVYLKLDQENRTPKPRNFNLQTDYENAINLKRKKELMLNKQSKKLLKSDADRATRDTLGMNKGIKIPKALK